jgi:predicted N-formylglutamate amidohydrolase
LVGDHAGNRVPARLRRLGITDVELNRHIGWDIGVRALGERLSSLLDATFVAQRFSRLVIDCNRDPASADAATAISDGTRIPNNDGLEASALEERRRAIHAPYHERIARELDRRIAAGKRPLFVSLHSFTPSLGDRPRPWQLGVLYDGGETALSRALLAEAGHDDTVLIGDNEPYRMDGTDYTVPRHAISRSLPYLELEFRQDELCDHSGVHAWAERFRRWFVGAARSLHLDL